MIACRTELEAAARDRMHRIAIMDQECYVIASLFSRSAIPTKLDHPRGNGHFDDVVSALTKESVGFRDALQWDLVSQ